MSKTREIKEMSDDEFVKFLKHASKSANQASQTMEKNFERGLKEIIDFWQNR